MTMTLGTTYTLETQTMFTCDKQKKQDNALWIYRLVEKQLVAEKNNIKPSTDAVKKVVEEIALQQGCKKLRFTKKSGKTILPESLVPRQDCNNLNDCNDDNDKNMEMVMVK